MTAAVARAPAFALAQPGAAGAGRRRRGRRGDGRVCRRWRRTGWSRGVRLRCGPRLPGRQPPRSRRWASLCSRPLSRRRARPLHCARNRARRRRCSLRYSDGGGTAPRRLAAGAPPLARVSLGAAFWVLFAAAALAMVDAIAAGARRPRSTGAGGRRGGRRGRGDGRVRLVRRAVAGPRIREPQRCLRRRRRCATSRWSLARSCRRSRSACRSAICAHRRERARRARSSRPSTCCRRSRRSRCSGC